MLRISKTEHHYFWPHLNKHGELLNDFYLRVIVPHWRLINVHVQKYFSAVYKSSYSIDFKLFSITETNISSHSAQEVKG